jgi:hypothetical protein
MNLLLSIFVLKRFPINTPSIAGKSNIVEKAKALNVNTFVFVYPIIKATEPKK